MQSVCVCARRCEGLWLYPFVSVFLSVFLTVYLYFCLFLCLSVSLSVCLSVCLADCLSACLSVCLSVYVSVCMSATRARIGSNLNRKFLRDTFFPPQRFALNVFNYLLQNCADIDDNDHGDDDADDNQWVVGYFRLSVCLCATGAKMLVRSQGLR